MLPSINEAASMQLSVRQSSVVLSPPPPDGGEGLSIDTVTPNTIASTTNANTANIRPIPACEVVKTIVNFGRERV